MARKSVWGGLHELCAVHLRCPTLPACFKGMQARAVGLPGWLSALKSHLHCRQHENLDTCPLTSSPAARDAFPLQLPATAGVQSGPLSRDPQGAAFMQQYYSAYGVGPGGAGGGPQGRLLRAGDGDPKVHSDSEVRRFWTTRRGAAGSSSGSGGSGLLHYGGFDMMEVRRY